MMRLRQQASGFTLLEVMVALAILATSLTILAQSYQGNLRATTRGRFISVATLLARDKMVEVEDELFKDGFSDFEETKTGDFGEQGHQSFRYELKVERIELPEGVNADSLKDAASQQGSGEGASGGSGASTAANSLSMGSKLMAQQFELFRNVLKESIRRVTLKVLWREGSADQSFVISAYFTDARKIDAITGGLGGFPPPIIDPKKDDKTPPPGKTR